MEMVPLAKLLLVLCSRQGDMGEHLGTSYCQDSKEVYLSCKSLPDVVQKSAWIPRMGPNIQDVWLISEQLSLSQVNMANVQGKKPTCNI